MRKLGISIYPEKSEPQRVKEYLDLAAKYGFSRVFSSLLQVDGDVDLVKANFKEINDYAKAKGFEVIVDIAPRIFSQLGISYQDLSFFKEIGADGLRLDAGFSGAEEAMMTFNPQGLKVEINMSNDVHTIDTIMDFQPNAYQLYGCHNFYPHNYSGLGLDFFKRTSQRFKHYGLRTAAFVTSQVENSFGPWPVEDGLPTLEGHRHLPLDVQVKHLLAMNAVDDILISNCYASEEELKAVGQLDLSLVTLDVDPVASLGDIESKILFDEFHFNRGDQSQYFLRSTQSRVKYKGYDFPVFNAVDTIKRGDVIIESSEYGHYAGELQIALKDMQNSGKSNVVGHIRPEEVFILDEIKPWQKFKLKRA